MILTYIADRPKHRKAVFAGRVFKACASSFLLRGAVVKGRHIFHFFVSVSLVATWTSLAIGQSLPTDKDSAEYRDAYGLIFDSHLRAQKAEKILTRNGEQSLDSLTERDLSLLCRIYNELGDTKKQTIVAKKLWQRDSRTDDAVLWIYNSLANTLYLPGGPEEVLEFLDRTQAGKEEHVFELLLLKAQAVIATKNGLTDIKIKSMVSDLLVEAYVFGKPIETPYSATDGESPDFVDQNDSFREFFSTEERESLKARMIESRTKQREQVSIVSPKEASDGR